MSTRKSTKGFLFGALAGGVLGSITALLLAPKPGKELRQDISTGAQKLGDSTVRAAERAYDATGRIAKGIGTGAVQMVDRTKEAAGNLVNSVKGIRTEDDDISEGDAIASIASLSTEAGEELAANALENGEIADIVEIDSAKQI